MRAGKAPKPATQVVLSFVLSFVTLFLIRALNYLPYSPSRDALSDLLASPGALIAGLFYAEGVHTGRGSPGWAYVAIIANAVAYAIVWFFFIRIVNRFRYSEQ